MADESKNITISKKNSGFPDYLDFDKLRTEGISYLGKLGGKIWTDHNVHDPGITILEVLCYALLDLGYRTNLPEADIFTRNPEDQTSDNNFFTPAQILACNPLTITDFRKLLIDIEGVKNAWLEIATDQTDICRPVRQPDPNSTNSNTRQNPCVDYLNGLYHVYIDLEKNIAKDFPTAEKAKEYLEDKEKKIRNALMAHRNLCEDFIDIFFLCKQETGVCADIELEDGADPEKVYLDTVEKLRAFFSPSPQFYTLQELLDKEKPIDEIFGGRPYNITESHGFVDTAEFEQLKLRKEIHLSDVYNVLFEVDGVRSVRKLRLQTCGSDTTIPQKENGWKYHIPKNHVPEFSVSCSGFQFTRNGMPVFVDFKKFEGLLAINFTHNGKIQYQVPSPYLNLDIPKGVYRADIGDYYSIQNEFPQVYGIAEGGLPDSASPLRKAQAYQLKAYLLFFDQLLANYLAQLQHIRSLFALSAPKDQSENHTYFSSQLNSVPDLQKLLRFNISENNNNSLGSEGSLLVLPIDKKKLLELKDQDKLKTLELEDISTYSFSTLAEQDIAISQLKDDLFFEQIQCEFVTKNDDCVFYYILTSSDEIALISRKYFKSIQEATENSTSVKYIGTFDENYRSYVTTGNSFSFDIELNLLSFSKYLQLIVEDQGMFYQRRQGFLNHLLSRFAEQFTDYAMLSFGFYSSQLAEAAIIRNKENFLTHYDDLSSNRGKAYDYLENNWNNDNVSGFEKKFKAISGIENWKHHSLCNFIVAEYENQFAVTLNIAGANYFSTEENFDSREEALTVAQSLFNALRDKANYSTELIPQDNAYQLKINYATNRSATYPAKFSSKEEALTVTNNLTGLFTEKPAAESVFESHYLYFPQLKDSSDNVVRRSVKAYPSDEKAVSAAIEAVKKIDDRKKWDYPDQDPPLGEFYLDTKNPAALSFINTDAFKFDINNTIVGKPKIFSYDVLDKENNFKFSSVKEFDDPDQARTNANELLILLTDESNYRIAGEDDASELISISIVNKEETQAINAIKSNSRPEAEKLAKLIQGIAKKHQYFIAVDKVPNGWRFKYELGYDKNNFHVFNSVTEYETHDQAVVAVDAFNKAVSTLEPRETENELSLIPSKDNINVSPVIWVPQAGNAYNPQIKTAVTKLLQEQKEIKRLSGEQNPEAFTNSVAIDEISRQGLFVYRLVDKDRIPAFYNKNFTDKAGAIDGIKNVVKLSRNYNGYLQLCMGGDNIVERKHPLTNISWYRYQLKCLNQFYTSGSMAGKALILFESSKRFSTKEEAEKAFLANYLLIINIASSVAGYDKKISLEEIPIDAEDRLAKTDSIVFVPKITVENFGASTAIAMQEIINLALTYPIRISKLNSAEFDQLFPCDAKDDKEPAVDDCKKETEKYVYYFILTPNGPVAEKWQSLNFYETAEAARMEFDFFLILLYYPGNYYVDCDRCSKQNTQYRIYIREVLAESTERFTTEELAWGVNGLQKFICVSQTEDPFHNYLRKENCCYSFYVSCGNGMIYHPCKYDRPQKRDAVLLKLYQALNEFQKKKSWQADDNGDNIVLLNESGESFASFATRNQANGCNSDLVAGLSSYVLKDENYKEENGRLVLKSENNETIVISTKDAVQLEDWKATLRTFTCYYPIVKTKEEKTGRDSYCIEIRFPGFNTCKEDVTEDKPCGCGEKAEEDPYDCYIAWKSSCCYTSCAEAERALQTILKLLLNYEYYQPVFDCVCASYGITIQFSKNTIIKDENISYFFEDANIRNWQSSEIIAINPQCYPGPEIACKAVSRAKKLINSEGLHLVEHILLRPRCFPDDCQCREYSKICDDETGCEFKWTVPDDDPCTDIKSICFVPGTDRYSFIATVALPAWPARFRKAENRQLLENILYREAPAHVLLRILWLAPHDFCCFETKFKDWNRWLAQKKTCIDNFTVCDFMDFLFERNYECLNDCNVCVPCDDNQNQPLPCFADTQNTRIENTFLSQVNDLFCWRDQICASYEFIDCDSQVQVPDNNNPVDPVTPILLNREEPPVEQPRLTKAARKNGTEKKESKSADKKLQKTEETEPAPERVALSKSKPRLVNSRMNKYRTSTAAILERSKNNPIADRVQSFLSDPVPSQERLSKLVTEILQNKEPKTKGSKTLTKKQVFELLQNSICYYLDKICFNGKDTDKLNDLKKIFEKLRKAKIDIQLMYDYWNFPEIKENEPALNEELLKNLFMVETK